MNRFVLKAFFTRYFIWRGEQHQGYWKHVKRGCYDEMLQADTST
jgi:hypothetical protein